MRFLCDRSRLEAALAPVLSAIPVKDAPKPALKSLYLRADEDALVLQGSNLDLSAEVRLEAVKVEQPGSCLVPAKQFHSLVHEVPESTLRVEVESGTLKLPTASGKFEMVTGAADDYPDLSFDQTGTTLGVPIQVLKRHLQATEFACAREATRYAMNGILLAAKNGKLSTVGTDGRRLALISTPLEKPDELSDGPDGWQALLPHKSLTAAIRALDSLTGDEVGMHINEGSVCFTVPDASLSVQRIQGAFPDYDKVVPQGCSNVVEFNRAVLEANLRRVRVLTEDINPAVRITFEGSQAKFESEAAGLGQAETVMDIDLSGIGGSITFNPNFISDVLRVVQEDQVKFEFHDANAPGKFVFGEDYVYVLMPITGI